MGQDLEKIEGIPVVWVISKLNGKTENNLFVARKKAEKLLDLVMKGHEDIIEPFENLKYLGTFTKETSPF